MDFNQLKARLGRTGLVQAIVGLLAFVLSFFAWVKADIPAELRVYVEASGVSTTHNAWQQYASFGAWFPCLLLFGLGVVAVLVALEIMPRQPMALIGFLVGALATLIILLRWMTLADHISAAWALYVTLLMAIGVTAVSYMGMAAEGTSLAQIPQAFQKSGTGGGEQPPQA